MLAIEAQILAELSKLIELPAALSITLRFIGH